MPGSRPNDVVSICLNIIYFPVNVFSMACKCIVFWSINDSTEGWGWAGVVRGRTGSRDLVGRRVFQFLRKRRSQNSRYDKMHVIEYYNARNLRKRGTCKLPYVGL